MWVITACLSALFAGITSILAKCGIRRTDADVATAIRTGIVLLLAWAIVLIVGSAPSIRTVSLESVCFLILSGIATGISWICYFRALSLTNVNKIAPIDKSSTVLTSILAIVLFQETNHLFLKLFCIVLIFAGTILMIQKSNSTDTEPSSSKWLIYAILSAVFAALTSIFAKIGIENVESNLGTAIRTGVVLVIAWGIIFAKKKYKLIPAIPKKDLLFILLSGLTTGASWLCYYHALQTGIVSVVAPIDKLSLAVTILFSLIFLKEKLSLKAWIGFFLILAGTIFMTIYA